MILIRAKVKKQQTKLISHKAPGSGRGNISTERRAFGSSRGDCHAALDRILLLPAETYAGDPGTACSRMDDSPDDPGISNAWDSSDARGASGGGPSRGA